VPLVTIASPSDDSVRVSRGFAGRQADRVRRGDPTELTPLGAAGHRYAFCQPAVGSGVGECAS
ncbi:hypothetical protein, partial [Nonomuraea sp. NPDC050202]|uniref:hypothetical protein n=1 Tax=Nonomuraea sp. NPDC050202 TaxID=3155035 RepID=UPI0033CA830C